MEYLSLLISSLSLFVVVLLYFKLSDKAPRKSEKQAVIDTCALIDGRIEEIARSGFMPATIVVPQFVIEELQYLADHGNSQKRERARFGLQVIKNLQDSKHVEVEISREEFSNIKEVDAKLVELSKQRKSVLYTTDYNLNKVADIEGVTVLNVNELAHLLRPVVLPGETKDIKIVQKGNERSQGVGYLEDGTMVVVENAAKLIGKTVTVEFNRSLQTVAGKMLFAVLKKPNKPNPKATKSSSN